MFGYLFMLNYMHMNHIMLQIWW